MDVVLVGIVGPSGSGKSTSIFKEEKLKIKGLDPKDTFIFNVSGKPLPVKGGDKLYPNEGKISETRRQYKNCNAADISKFMVEISEKVKTIKHMVVDDAQFLQAFKFMESIKEKGYEKFNDIGAVGFNPVRVAMKLTGENLIVFFMYHSETDKKGNDKIKTAGQLIDQYVTMEGLFTIVLYAESEFNPLTNKIEYFFKTNSDGRNTAKSPYGMFDDLRIPNDLGYVSEKIREYYQ